MRNLHGRILQMWDIAIIYTLYTTIIVRVIVKKHNISYRYFNINNNSNIDRGKNIN